MNGAVRPKAVGRQSFPNVRCVSDSGILELRLLSLLSEMVWATSPKRQRFNEHLGHIALGTCSLMEKTN